MDDFEDADVPDIEARLKEIEDAIDRIEGAEPTTRSNGSRDITLSGVSADLERLQIKVTDILNALEDAGIKVPLR